MLEHSFTFTAEDGTQIVAYRWSDDGAPKAIVQIAHGLGKRTVAEFVGDDATLRMLGRFGVDFAQGYFTGRPAAINETWPPGAPEHVRSAPLE